jgi:hypothetical protein
MRALGAVVLILALAAERAAAQAGSPLPVPPETRKRSTSSTEVYERESVFKKKYESESDRRHALEEELQHLRGQLTGSTDPAAAETAGAPGSAGGATPGAESAPLKLEVAPVPGPAARPPKVKRTAARAPAPPPPNEQPLVFAVSPAALQEASKETAVPLGSYVKARVLTGVEANTMDAYPVLLQLDYAFVGPNHTRVDLSNCFVIAKAKANLSTERVMGETTQISCVRENNEVVTRAAKGYLAGEDSTFGLTGQLISHQGRVLVAAVLASLAKSVGEAVATAQTSTEVAAGNGAVAQATNVTGSKLAFVAGKAVTEPASMIANWYLEYAKQLVPSIAVGSGRDVWIVLLDTVQVPSISADDEGDYR